MIIAQQSNNVYSGKIYNGQQRLIMLDRQIAVMKNFRRKDSPLYLKLQAIKDAILPKTMPVDSAV
jgi:hypothetical protein